MAEAPPPPAYVGNEPPPPVPPIQVVTAEKPKKKFPIPIWLVILFVVGLWLSGMAIFAIYFFLGKNTPKETDSVAPAQQPVITVIITETPAPANTFQKQASKPVRILNNAQFGYTLEVPDTWKLEEESPKVWLYDSAATAKDQPSPFPFGRLLIQYEHTSDQKIITWFDLTYPQNMGLSHVPVKKKLYTNPGGVEILETGIEAPSGRLRYYFNANGQIVTLTFKIGRAHV